MFLSLTAVRQYFEENEYIRRILHEVLSRDGLPVRPIDFKIILNNYIRILCILIEIGKERNLELFMSHGVNDLLLPLYPDRLSILTSNPNLNRAFFDCQWKYCVPEFNARLANTTFDKDRILPIVSKEKIGEGSTATIYQIKLHPLYDKFEPPVTVGLPWSDFLVSFVLINLVGH